MSYSYFDSAHDHAVTPLDGTQRYWYDANGNQSKRVLDGTTDELRYDAENRLVEVERGGCVPVCGLRSRAKARGSL